jgi:hypothetical protein
VLDHRGQLLRAALGFAGLSRPTSDRALHALRTWLDSWPGTGHVAVGMACQGYDLQLTRYDDRGWRATFYTTGMEHSPTSATGTGWERTPWHATQRAAWETLKKMSATNYTLGWMLRLALCVLMLAGCGPVTYGPEPPPATEAPDPSIFLLRMTMGSSDCVGIVGVGAC